MDRHRSPPFLRLREARDPVVQAPAIQTLAFLAPTVQVPAVRESVTRVPVTLVSVVQVPVTQVPENHETVTRYLVPKEQAH